MNKLFFSLIIILTFLLFMGSSGGVLLNTNLKNHSCENLFLSSISVEIVEARHGDIGTLLNPGDTVPCHGPWVTPSVLQPASLRREKSGRPACGPS